MGRAQFEPARPCAPQVKLIVILGELGGQDEYGVVEALKAGAITKPVVRARAHSGPCTPACATHTTRPPAARGP